MCKTKDKFLRVRNFAVFFKILNNAEFAHLFEAAEASIACFFVLFQTKYMHIVNSVNIHQNADVDFFPFNNFNNDVAR